MYACALYVVYVVVCLYNHIFMRLYLCIYLCTVLPVQIYLWKSTAARGFVELTAAGVIVLLTFLILMNALAIYVRNKFEKKW